MKFAHHKFEAMDQLQDITENQLKEIGLSAMGHRMNITRAIKAHFKKAKEANKAIVRNDNDLNPNTFNDEDDTKTEDDFPFFVTQIITCKQTDNCGSKSAHYLR
eukprot:388657_1